MRRLGILFFALALAQGCNCGSKPHVNNTSGIVVLSDGTNDVTEDDLGLDFSSACLASSNVDPTVRSFFIKNSGENVLAIQSLTLGGNDTSSFRITTSPLPTSVAPGAEAEVDVSFSPQSTGNKSATIAVATDDPNKPEVNVRLVGQGAVKPAQATYLTSCAESDGGATGSPVCSALDFVDTQVGSTSSQTLHITNNGCPPLLINSMSFDGSLPDGGAAFHLHGSPSFPITIASGASQDLQIDFAPTSLDDSYGDLYVTTNGVPDPSDPHQGFLQDGGALPENTFYVMLNGTPVQPRVTLTPTTCTFSLDAGSNACQPVIVGGGPDLSAEFLLINSGNVGVQVSSISIPADDAGVFSINVPSNPPFTLGASGTSSAQVPITVVYHPFNGFLGEDLVVATSSGTLSSHLIAGSPAIIDVPAELDFNDTSGDPLTFSSPRDLPVHNSGASPLRISGYSFTQTLIDGGDGPCTFDSDGGPVQRFVPLAPDAGGFPLTVAPGDISTWSIDYRADAIGGSRECALHIASNDPGTPDANVRLLATTYANCAPIAVMSPDNTTADGGVTLSAGSNGGIYTIDGTGSYDTDSNTSPVCPNGKSNGLEFFDWKLTGDISGFPYGSRLESPAPGQSTCLALTSDGGCVEWRVTQVSTTFPPYDAPTINVVVSGSDQPQTLSLTVTDPTGLRSNTDKLTIHALP